MDKKVSEMTKEKRVNGMIDRIQQAAVEFGLNLTIVEGKLGFVDQSEGKIIALWGASHKLSELQGESNE